MARTFKIVKGNEEVNLINTAATGIIISRGGGGRNRIRPSLTFTSSSLTDGAKLRAKNYPIVAETYTINFKGGTHDGFFTILQTLQRILLDADDHQLTNWQQSPVYITQQTSDETNSRHSTIIAWDSQALRDLFDFPFEGGGSDIDEAQITIFREPFWRGTAPGTLSSKEPIKAPDFPYFDVETISGSGAIDYTAAAAQAGDWGVAFTLAAAADTAFGIIKDPNNLAEFSIQFEINSDDLTMANGDEFRILRTVGSGTSATTFIVVMEENTGVRRIKATLNDDAPAATSTSFYNLPSGKSTVLVEWKASTGPGNDDGELRLSIDASLKETLSSVDNDTYDVDTIQIGAVLNVDAGTSGDLYMDTIQYDDASPFSAAFRTEDFEVTEQHVSNFRHTNTISHIFMEDSGTGFSANLFQEPSFPYFEVSGSTPAANDAAYFGGASPHFVVALNIITAAVVTAATFVLEYWNGSAWTAFAGNSPSLNSLLTGETGVGVVRFDGASDWVANLVNGQTKFWFRIRITGVTSWTSSPVQGDQIVYTPNDTYYELNNVQVHGDKQALLLERLRDYGSENDISFVGMGMKTRGLTNFTGRLNFGGQNPTFWAETYDTDTTQTADPTAPGGNNATCDFATDQTLIQRSGINITGAGSGAASADFEGTYRIYLRAKQLNGSAGDVSIKLNIARGVIIQGETIPMKQADEDIELVDLGTFTIYNTGVLGDEIEVDQLLEFRLFASSSNGTTPDLELHDLVLIPMDEDAINTFTAIASQDMSVGQGYAIDSGILREESVNFAIVDLSDQTINVRGEIQSRGALPRMKPRKQTRVYFIFGKTNSTTNVLESTQSLGAGAELFLHEIWLTGRGLD